MTNFRSSLFLMQIPALFPHAQGIKFYACISFWLLLWDTDLFRQTQEAIERHHQQHWLPTLQDSFVFWCTTVPVTVGLQEPTNFPWLYVNGPLLFFPLFQEKHPARTNSRLHSPAHTEILAFCVFLHVLALVGEVTPMSGEYLAALLSTAVLTNICWRIFLFTSAAGVVTEFYLAFAPL